MSTKKPESKQKEPVYCIRCRMLAKKIFCIHGEVTAKDPIEPGKAQWARNVNANNDCPYFEAIPKPRVYCMDCMSFRNGLSGNIIGPSGLEELSDGSKCLAPENMKDTHRAPRSKPDRKPSEINYNNDCPWFRGKPKEPERTVGDVRKEADELNKAILDAGAALLSEIAPKRPWWKFWQRKEA